MGCVRQGMGSVAERSGCSSGLKTGDKRKAETGGRWIQAEGGDIAEGPSHTASSFRHLVTRDC